MKHFTTPEQSERLLAIGVPVDSADMYYKHTMLTPYILNDGVLFSVYSKVEDITPCWSVGQLIDIFCIVTESINITIPYQSKMLCEVMVRTFEHRKKHLDFSKLED